MTWGSMIGAFWKTLAKKMDRVEVSFITGIPESYATTSIVCVWLIEVGIGFFTVSTPDELFKLRKSRFEKKTYKKLCTFEKFTSNPFLIPKPHLNPSCN